MRLRSLDLLRGADIFFLTIICPLVWAFNDGIHALPESVLDQFLHPEWVGFSVHDIIMPLFLFMSGAALPLALPKRLNADGKAGWTYWRHVLVRVAMLWALGMFAQGEITSFDLHRISFFNNTLQTIACGYLITAAVMRIENASVRRAVPFVLVFVYGLFLHLCGDMTPDGNAAVVYETKFLNLFYPADPFHPEGGAACHAIAQIAEMHYTWWPTIPMFGFMALMGAESTIVLRSQMDGNRKFRVLVFGAVGLLALGGLCAIFDPIVKHIFTPSFTLLAMGICVLLYAVFFYAFDIRGIQRGTWILQLFGRHSLLAYLMGDTILKTVLFSVSSIALYGPQRECGFGLSRFFSEDFAAHFLPEFFAAGLIIYVLYFMDTHKRPR